jgi:hypothetical protein
MLNNGKAFCEKESSILTSSADFYTACKKFPLLQNTTITLDRIASNGRDLGLPTDFRHGHVTTLSTLETKIVTAISMLASPLLSPRPKERINLLKNAFRLLVTPSTGQIRVGVSLWEAQCAFIVNDKRLFPRSTINITFDGRHTQGRPQEYVNVKVNGMSNVDTPHNHKRGWILRTLIDATDNIRCFRLYG